MAWKDAQCDEIVEAFWRGETPRCPNDESILDVNKAGHFGGYDLYARCPRCNDYMNRGSNEDPQKAKFRPWTDAEREKMVDDYFRHRQATCPVCDTTVTAHEIRGAGPMAVAFNCPRCLNAA
jgi:hypothetical protein